MQSAQGVVLQTLRQSASGVTLSFHVTAQEPMPSAGKSRRVEGEPIEDSVSNVSFALTLLMAANCPIW